MYEYIVVRKRWSVRATTFFLENSQSLQPKSMPRSPLFGCAKDAHVHSTDVHSAAVQSSRFLYHNVPALATPESLQALEAKRDLPSASDANESVLSASALLKLDVSLPDTGLTTPALEFFAEHGDSIRSRGVSELQDLVRSKPAARFRPWAQPSPLHGMLPSQREQEIAEELRLGHALWRLTRLELAEMTAQDATFASLWLDALVQGSLPQPPSAAVPEAAADEPGGQQRAALLKLAALMRAFAAAMRAAPPHLVRSRCEMALAVAKPETDEAPESFGRLNWDYGENGPPRPFPREGRFTLFARLPRSAKTGGPLPNDPVALRIGAALVEAGIVASVSVVRGGGYEYGLEATYARRGARPPLGSDRTAEFSGLDAGGSTACLVSVDSSLGPAPAFDGGRYGNLVTVHWLGTPKCKAEPTAVKRAIRPAAWALAAVKKAGGSGGKSSAASTSSAGSTEQQQQQTSGERLTAFGCSAVRHSVLEVSIPERPDLLLRCWRPLTYHAPRKTSHVDAGDSVALVAAEARRRSCAARCLIPCMFSRFVPRSTSGASEMCDKIQADPKKTSKDGQCGPHAVSTLWSLLRDGEEARHCTDTVNAPSQKRHSFPQQRHSTCTTAAHSHRPLSRTHQVARCLMTYQNSEARSYGPTIELFGVRKSARGSGLSRILFESIARELKGGSKHTGWFPRDAYFGLQLCDVISAHAFFEKMGFSWDEEVEEDGEGFAQFNMKAVIGSKYRDAVKVVHRVRGRTAVLWAPALSGGAKVPRPCAFASLTSQAPSWRGAKWAPRDSKHDSKHGSMRMMPPMLRSTPLPRAAFATGACMRALRRPAEAGETAALLAVPLRGLLLRRVPAQRLGEPQAGLQETREERRLQAVGGGMCGAGGPDFVSPH